MTTPGVVLGRRLGPFPGRIDADLVDRYKEATRDPNPGDGVPPVAIVTQIWDAQVAGFHQLVPEEVLASMQGGVHGGHDVVLHRPVAVGEELQTFVEGHGSRRGGRHDLVTLRYTTYAGDELVAEQWWTTVLIGAEGDPVGEDPPDHTVEPGGDVGERRIETDLDMPRRYAEVSQDFSPHHFDPDAARQSGFERPFLHGLCTLAVCAHVVVSLSADGEPERVRRIAVRFGSPAFVGDAIIVRVARAGGRTVAFEAEAGGAAVARRGVVELR
jgi:acyl dehydratase